MLKNIKFEEIILNFHLYKTLTNEEKINYINYIQMRELMVNLEI